MTKQKLTLKQRQTIKEAEEYQRLTGRRAPSCIDCDCIDMQSMTHEPETGKPICPDCLELRQKSRVVRRLCKTCKQKAYEFRMLPTKKRYGPKQKPKFIRVKVFVGWVFQ